MILDQKEAKFMTYFFAFLEIFPFKKGSTTVGKTVLLDPMTPFDDMKQDLNIL